MKLTKIIVPSLVMILIIPLIFVGLPLAQATKSKWDNNGHYYEIVTKELNWDEAETYAENQQFTDPNTGLFYKGHLATINSAEEKSWIVKNQISSTNFVYTYGEATAFWLGGYQEQGYTGGPIGGWRWITNEPWSWTNWGQGELNDAGGKEKFLQMYTDGTWNDNSIDGRLTTRYSLIEYEPSPIKPDIGTGQCTPVELTQGVIRSPDDNTAYVEFKVTNARALSYINIHVPQGKIDYVAQVKEDKVDPIAQLSVDALELEFSLAQEFIPLSGTAFTGIEIILNRLNPEDKDPQNYRLTSPSSGIWVIKMEGTQALSPNAEISVAYDPAYCDQSVSGINSGSLSYYTLETDMLQNIISQNYAEVSFPYSVKNLDGSDYTGGGIEVSPALKLGNANYFEIKVTKDLLPDIVIRTQSDAKVDYVSKVEESSEGKRRDDLRNLGSSAIMDFPPFQGIGTVYTVFKILAQWLPSNQKPNEDIFPAGLGTYLIKVEGENGAKPPDAEIYVHFPSGQNVKYTPLGNGEIYTYRNIPFKLGGASIDVWHTNIKKILNTTLDLSGYSAKAIHILEAAGYSDNVPNNVLVGHVRAYYKDDTFETLDLISGENIAEWAYDKEELQPFLKHKKISPAYSFPTTQDSAKQYYGHWFYAKVDTNPNKPLDHLDLILDANAYTNQKYYGYSAADWYMIGIKAITLEGSIPNH